MRHVNGLAQLLPKLVTLCVCAAGISMAPSATVRAGELPNYLDPQVQSQSRENDAAARKLSARTAVQRIFKSPPGQRPNLEATDLAGFDLAEVDFKAALLGGANLYGADLSNARLAGASLIGANLDRATVTGTDFSNADLTDARIVRPTVFTTLEVVTTEAPKFTGAKLVRTRSDGMFERADFSGADLTDAIFGPTAVREPVVNSPASLAGANFTGAILKKTKLAGTDLSYTRFNDADLTGADLTGTDLINANFAGADLTGTNLTGANLYGADLRTARGLDKAVGLSSALNLNAAYLDRTP